MYLFSPTFKKIQNKIEFKNELQKGYIVSICEKIFLVLFCFHSSLYDRPIFLRFKLYPIT